MVASVIGDDITVRTVLDPALRPTLIDEGRLGQVLLNLAINARDAMPGGGELRFETANLDARESAQIAGLDGTEHVRLSVIDTGTGMPPDVARRAIEPFFTTKPSGRGTGLGLATSYGLVKQAGGQLVIDTAEGRGTAVHLYLPAA
nr:ATP-binding protein [Actinoplanes regularis]